MLEIINLKLNTSLLISPTGFDSSDVANKINLHQQ